MTMAEEQAENSEGRQDRAAHLEAYRWQPGQSGNPQGRPRGRTFEEAVRAVLAEEIEPGVTKLDRLAETFVDKLLAGHMDAIRLFLRRDWPEVKQVELQAPSSKKVLSWVDIMRADEVINELEEGPGG
jgi:hypothetical protein